MHGELPKPNTKVTPATGPMRSKRGRLLIYLVVLIAVGGALYYVFGQKAEQQQRRGRFFAGDGPVPVLAANAQYADVPVYLDAVGTTKALNTVTVRSQVDGKLLSVNFKEGQDVRRGDILAQIDPTTFQATLDQAIAKKAMDEALLSNAKNDLARYEQLATTNAINKQQTDTQRALVAQYTAQVQSDQAAIESAQATLNYATIRAPIDGRTGLRQVDEGNIVRSSDSSGIVVITQLRPISIQFNLPQQYLGEVNDAFAKGPLEVDAQRSDNDAVLDRGTLTVVDNQVDSTTGTVKLKAEFPNANLQLWPGQFANIRLLINTLQHVVTIPTGAVQRGPNGTFVYVIKDSAASMRPIVVERQDETRTVVKSGLTPPEQVVTTGFARLTDGAKVSVSSGEIKSAPATTAPRARGQGQNGATGASGQQRPNRQQ